MVIFTFSVSMHTTRTSSHLYVNNKQKHLNEKLPVPQQLIIYVDHPPPLQNNNCTPKTRRLPRVPKQPSSSCISGRITLIIPALLSLRVLQNPCFLLPAWRRSCRAGYFGAWFWGLFGGQILLSVALDMALGRSTEPSRVDPNWQMQKATSASEYVAHQPQLLHTVNQPGKELVHFSPNLCITRIPCGQWAEGRRVWEPKMTIPSFLLAAPPLIPLPSFSFNIWSEPVCQLQDNLPLLGSRKHEDNLIFPSHPGFEFYANNQGNRCSWISSDIPGRFRSTFSKEKQDDLYQPGISHCNGKFYLSDPTLPVWACLAAFLQG